jgi:hypothetical protein
MRHTAKEFGWNPVVFDIFDQNFLVQNMHWGDLMLNADSYVCEFQNAKITEDMFIRPIDDSKYFAGKVFSPEEFHDWQHNVVDLKEDYGNSLTASTKIQLSVPKFIYSEYRFWIIDGQIMTSSMYKRGDRVLYSSDVDARFYHFVDSVISMWQPHRAFVIDVCETYEGIKIVEINTINSSGFYAGDIQKLVVHLNGMKFYDDPKHDHP